MNRKKLVVALAGGATALSLIGAGVGASFTDAASATASATQGTVNFQVSTDGGSTYSKSATLTPAQTDLTSAGGTHDYPVYVENSGSLTEWIHSIYVGRTGNIPMTATFTVNGNTMSLNDGSNPENLQVPAGYSGPATISITVPPNDQNGGTGSITLTTQGTDQP